MSRSDYYKELGAPPRTNFSWSAVNHLERKIYFGAWTNEIKSLEGGTRILSSDWEKTIIKKTGKWRRNPNYSNSLSHISLVQHNAYRLFTFPQTPKYSEDGRIKIDSYQRVLTSCYLVFEGHNCFAVPEKGPAVNNGLTENTEMHSEGARFQVLQTGYERNSEARRQCLEKHGYSCVVCRFDFARTYGSIGKEFIHVHHLVRMVDRPKPYLIDGATELRPVCPNCHAMMHKRIPPYTVKEIQEKIEACSKGLMAP